MRFSDRCLVHDGDGALRFRAAPWWSTRSSAWRAPAWTGQLTRRGPVHFPPTATPPCPGCPVFPGAVLSDQGVGQHEKLVHGGARRVEPTDLAPVQTADDGTLTRERYRLACGSPSRAPGRRPGGVTLGFSDRCPVSGARRRRRHPVPYSPWWSTRPPAWRAPAWTRRTSRPLPRRRAPVVRSSPGRFCPTRALASTRSLCMAAPDGSSRPTWPPFNGRRRNADAGAASPRLRLALPRPRSQTGGSDVGVQ